MITTLEKIPKAWLVPDVVLPLPSREAVRAALAGGPARIAELEKLLSDRAESLRLRKADPLHYGFEPDCVKDLRRLIATGFDEIYVTGANREGKSTGLVKIVVEDLFARKCDWGLFHNTERTSIDQQQKLVYDMLPVELRGQVAAKPIRRGQYGGSGYVIYNEATGFANQKFILPSTGSRCMFFNYGQPSSVWEGPEYDGLYFDEKVTLEILETSRYRRGRGKRLQIFVNFTPKWGFTPVVQNMVAGMTIVETRPAPLLEQNRVHVKGCPPGHMPYIAHGLRPGSALIWFHNRMNPLGAGVEMMRELQGAPYSRIAVRAYGWAPKTASGAFPQFGSAHIVKAARFAEIAARGGTRYVVADPAGGKNWVLQWFLATPEGFHILYREWPDKQNYEEWALSPGHASENEDDTGGRRHDWRPGPAQRIDSGRSLGSYIALILELEGWKWDRETKKWDGTKAEQIERRVMDPRFAGSPVPTEEEGVTIADRLNSAGMKDADGRDVPAMEFEPAPGGGTVREDTVQLLSDVIAYNENEPISILNTPKFFIHEDCLQARIAYEEYVAPPFSSAKNALKDLIDPGRYYFKSDCGYVDAKRARRRAGGYW